MVIVCAGAGPAVTTSITAITAAIASNSMIRLITHLLSDIQLHVVYRRGYSASRADATTINGKLRENREELGISKSELAQCADTTYQTIHNIEQGR
jgi:DNA-binding XRE family transcriptional regulator